MSTRYYLASSVCTSYNVNVNGRNRHVSSSHLHRPSVAASSLNSDFIAVESNVTETNVNTNPVNSSKDLILLHQFQLMEKKRITLTQIYQHEKNTKIRI